MEPRNLYEMFEIIKVAFKKYLTNEGIPVKEVRLTYFNSGNHENCGSHLRPKTAEHQVEVLEGEKVS